MENAERHPDVRDHRAAFGAIRSMLLETVAREASEIDAIGHRVVHGGESFCAPTRVDARVVDAIRALSPLAPLHNPANVRGIELCLELFPAVPQVAVFDTAFHHTLPPHAFHYALPSRLYRTHGVRRYGFHGTSHAYVAKRAAQHLGRALTDLNLISLHLGNGASAAAVQAGRCIDTSMGMTPLEGLVMGTRSGDLDPAIPFHLIREVGMDAATIENLLNTDSGLKGLCGANDMREVLRRGDAGDSAARLALDVYCYRIRKYIGAYVAALGSVDAVIFTAGVGENAPAVRQRSCVRLQTLGIHIDERKNQGASGDVAEIQARDSPVKLLVIRTNEEWEIAEQTRSVLAVAV